MENRQTIHKNKKGDFSKNFLLGVITILVSVSGWVTFIYQVSTSSPKIEGRIMKIYPTAFGTVDNQVLTMFLSYIYITNTRKNNVNILDYNLEVDLGNGYEKLNRGYGDEKTIYFENFPLDFSGYLTNYPDTFDELYINISDIKEKFLNRKHEPVEYGKPIHGFVLFFSDKPINYFIKHWDIAKFKLTVTDVFNEKYVIEDSTKDFLPEYLVEEFSECYMYPKSLESLIDTTKK